MGKKCLCLSDEYKKLSTINILGIKEFESCDHREVQRFWMKEGSLTQDYRQRREEHLAFSRQRLLTRVMSRLPDNSGIISARIIGSSSVNRSNYRI